MIADDGLHDGQSQASAVLLGRVVGSEKATAFFLGEAGACVGDGKCNSVDGLGGLGTDRQVSALGHGVDGVEDEVLQGAMQEVRVSGYLGLSWV